MKISTFLSEKLTFFSFWLMIGVVVLHSTIYSDIGYPYYFQKFISHYLMQICVPMFFMISGYLFFVNTPVLTWGVYKSKIKNRFITLFLPYVFWSLLIFLIVYLLQLIPFVESFFPNKFYLMSWKEQLYNAIIYPYNYPLWFLRELIFYMLLTPVLYFLIRKTGFLLVITVFVLQFYYDSLYSSVIDVIKLNTFLYFVLGCYLGLKIKNIEFKKNNVILYSAGFLFLSFNFILLGIEELNWKIDLGINFLLLIKRTKDFLGIIFLWQLYDVLIKDRQTLNIRGFYKYSFLIFVTHGIPTVMLTNLFKKFIFTPFISLLYYFIIPLVVVLIIIQLGKFIENVFNPRVYRFLTGSR